MYQNKLKKENNLYCNSSSWETGIPAVIFLVIPAKEPFKRRNFYIQKLLLKGTFALKSAQATLPDLRLRPPFGLAGTLNPEELRNHLGSLPRNFKKPVYHLQKG